jgi:hypothetical protein
MFVCAMTSCNTPLAIPILFAAIFFSAAPGCGPSFVVPLRDREAAQQELEQKLAEQQPQDLKQRIDQVLADGLNARRMNTAQNAAWQILHGVVCYGTELKIDTADRGLVGAIDYAFSGGQIMGFELLPGTEILPATGRRGIKARLEPGSYVGQGHPDQWLAVFAMAELPLDMQVQCDGASYTLLDWARQAQSDVYKNLLNEYSWTLIALTHYFPDEPTWQTSDGSEASWEMLVEAELTYDLDDSACGGTHRLAGIVRALQAKQRLNLADTPVWSEARAVVEENLFKAKQYRGVDGGLSSYYFTRPVASADLSLELASAGHVLEFVALALPQEQLSDAWVELAVNRLCEILESTRSIELDCGALYHGLKGLKIYRQRRFGGD